MHPNLSHQTCCCGHWICRAVPGKITPQLSLTSGFQVRYDQLPTLDPIVCSNWICRAVPGRITLQTQPNLELAIFKFILSAMSMFNFSCQVFRFQLMPIIKFMIHIHNQFTFQVHKHVYVPSKCPISTIKS